MAMLLVRGRTKSTFETREVVSCVCALWPKDCTVCHYTQTLSRYKVHLRCKLTAVILK